MQATDYAKFATKSFALPDICVRLREMLDDGSSDADDIAQVVAMDPSVSSKLLKLANSSLFRFQSQVTSISKAVNIIGGEALYNLVMAETAGAAFEYFSSDSIDDNRFWQQSVYCGLLAKHLAKIRKFRGSERFFVLGLLHDFGEVVVASQSPALADIANQYNEQVLPWQRQQQVLGFTYADCSAQILKQWQLPEPLTYPIEHLHDESKACKSADIGTLHVASRVALEMVEDTLYAPGSLTAPEVLAHLELETHNVKAAVRFARLEASSMLRIIRRQQEPQRY